MKAESITVAANSVLHDKSNNIQTALPTNDDRVVRYRNGTTTKQRVMGNVGMSNADTKQFITYTDRTDLLHDAGTGFENDTMKYLGEANLIGADGKATADGKTRYPGAILDTKKDGALTCAH